MGTRKRTNMSNLCSHATPKATYMPEEVRLQKKFDNGTITREELRKLASFMVIRKRATVVKTTEKIIEVKYFERVQHYIKCWDKWVPCTETQYNMAPECARKIGTVKVKTW